MCDGSLAFAVFFLIQLRQQSRECVGVNAKQLGSLAFVAFRCLEGLPYGFASQAINIEEREVGTSFPDTRVGQAWNTVQNVSLLDDVGKLPDISRPMEFAEGLQLVCGRFPERQ